MGLTTAMYTGLSGMNVNQTRIDTIGHNIANVNTTAFKSSRTLFQFQLSRILSGGSAPSETTGGTNPTQVGLGAVVGSTQRDMTPGSVETTGINSDVAIQGAGMFVLQRADGRQVYTRDGAFSLDANNRLVSMDGHAVRGFAVDSNFNVVPGVLSDLTIPVGTLSIAHATQNVTLDGDLSAGGTIATQGSTHATQTLVDGGGGLAAAGTALSDLRDGAIPGTTLFAAGNTITVSNLTRGGRVLPPRSFVIGTDGSTLGDFATWLQSAAGIDMTAGVPGTPGVTIENGQLVIRGNAGEANALGIDANVVRSDNGGGSLPFTFTQTAEANGSGVYTSFTAYDSLGNAVVANASYALEALTATGPVWRYYLTAPDGAGVLQAIGTGTVSFDNNGNYVSATGNQFNLDRSGTGATSPLQITLDFSQINGLSTELSNVIAASQDGYPPGTLANFGIGVDGTVSGTFTNGQSRTLGQLAVAVFSNDEGLIADTDNNYLNGPNSGEPVITTPGLTGAGQMMGGALELSNVDLSREFIGLITSSTAFQAASRVISTSSDMLDQLLLITR
ncbi:MAG: flagellar hook-basal body complex protein [Planctomycetes bacterium]|nr:flagellar hook-basal body complex protein [Planctomycetota bacterium]